MSEYVTNESWVHNPGRPDAVDDIADQFERHAPHVAQSTLPMHRAAAEQRVAARWPRSAGGWRSVGRLHPRAVERSADG